MIEFYAEIKYLHMLAALVSVSLFTVRGLGLLQGAQWPRHATLCYLSYGVDTLLLTAALMLMGIVRQYPFVHAWLTVKVLCVVLYILLGILAFRAVNTSKSRFVAFWLAALLIFGFIVSVARSHQPLGLLNHWLS